MTFGSEIRHSNQYITIESTFSFLIVIGKHHGRNYKKHHGRKHGRKHGHGGRKKHYKPVYVPPPPPPTTTLPPETTTLPGVYWENTMNLARMYWGIPVES